MNDLTNTQPPLRPRLYVTKPLPKELEQLEPLLMEMGYRWSNHFVPDGRPDDCWSIVSLHSGAAGRVGMDTNDAVECVIRMAVGRIKDYKRDRVSIAKLAAQILTESNG